MSRWTSRQNLARRLVAPLLAAAVLSPAWIGAPPARAADTSTGAQPIKVGCSLAMTGGVAANGKQMLLALEIWRDDVNARGGLLGRPVALDCYDDQSNPAMVPGIYTKLIDVDHVDLLVGPYATNLVAPALPVVMQHNMVIVSILALDVNAEFQYPRYFSSFSSGPEPKIAYSKGYFDLAAAQNPKPKTVAIIAADAEFAKNASDGARQNAKASGFTVVYDKTYPPSTTDFLPIMRAVQAANADIVYVAGYNPDTIGIIRAASEVRLKTKMFGGGMVGLLSTTGKTQLGPLINGIVNSELFLPAPTFVFPGTKEFLAKYQEKAPGFGVDPLGYAFAPFAYAAGQFLEQAVEGTKSLDQGKLADYMHHHSFKTILGEVAFGPKGEWTASRIVFTQFQHVAGHDVDQFRDVRHEVILYPTQYKTGDIIYPYTAAKE